MLRSLPRVRSRSGLWPLCRGLSSFRSWRSYFGCRSHFWLWCSRLDCRSRFWSCWSYFRRRSGLRTYRFYRSRFRTSLGSSRRLRNTALRLRRWAGSRPLTVILAHIGRRATLGCRLSGTTSRLWRWSSFIRSTRGCWLSGPTFRSCCRSAFARTNHGCWFPKASAIRGVSGRPIVGSVGLS
jgi:hypothetical protein